MTGTLINVATILIGGTLGIVMGGRLPERLRQTVMAGLGLFVLGLGVKMFLTTQNSLLVLGSLVVGILLGEWWRIEDGLHKLGLFLEQKFSHEEDDGSNRFVRGFMYTPWQKKYALLPDFGKLLQDPAGKP